MTGPEEAQRRCWAYAYELVAARYALTPVTLRRLPNGKKAPRYHLTWSSDDAVTTDPEVLRDWTVQYPDASFAIVCRVTGTEGTDLDADAPAWWRRNTMPVGGFRQRTPSGGEHHLWRAVRGNVMPTAAGTLTVAGEHIPGVDARGTGWDNGRSGGVFYAPGAYVWGLDDAPEPGWYEPLDPIVPVPDLLSTPDDVLKLDFTAGDRHVRPSDGRIVVKDREWADREYQALEARARDCSPEPGSGFRDALQGVGLFLSRYVEHGDVTRGEAEEHMRTIPPDVFGTDPDEDDERWIRDSLDDGARLERWRWRDDTTTAVAGDFLPRELWESTPALAHIRRAALSRIVSPDAVLHAVLAIVASVVHHRSRVDTGVRGSVLTHFVAMIGESGAGKTEALTVARDLLDGWLADRFAIVGADGYADTTLGSGEGVIDAFMGELVREQRDADGAPVLKADGNPRTETVTTQVRHNALLETDEGRQALAIAARSGSTLLGVLCELWSGSRVGQRNTRAGGRSRFLARGSYTLGLLLGFQPDTVGDLFSDVAGGAPQRFVFVPVAHPDHDPDVRVPWPGELALDVPVAAVTVTLPEEARDEVHRHRVAQATGRLRGAPLDGHRMLLRCRTAALLALLHGHEEVPPELWELAGRLVDQSCGVRDRVAALGTERARAEDDRREERAVRVAERSAKAANTHERVQRAAGQVVRAVEREGGRLTPGKARNTVRSDLRDVADAGIAYALGDGRLVESEGGKALGLPPVEEP